MLKINKLYNLDCREGLKQLDEDSIDCCISSPPYWSLRDYGIEATIWDEDPECEHEFEQIIENKEGYNNTGRRWQHGATRENEPENWNNSIKSYGFCSKCGCYDDKTEILTDNGWKLFKNLEDNDKVASLEDDFLKFVKPSNYFEYDWNDKMIHFYGQNIDLLVTPDHNMYVQKRSHKNKKEFYYKFEFIQARNTRIGYKVKRNLKWKGKSVEKFYLPEIKTKFNNHKKIEGIKLIDWLEFFGLWLADGYVYVRTRSYPEYFTAITQTKNKKAVEKILEKLPFSYSYNRGKDYVIYNKQLSLYLLQFGKTKEKYIPKEIKELNPKLLSHLLKGYLIGDGHIREDGRIEGYSISKQLVNDLQEIGLKIGYASTISKKKNNRKNRSELYRVAFIENQKKTRITHKEELNYRGKVYCVEVPSHILLVRRNGKPCWCGNSWKGCLGLEPDINLFIKHLCDIYDEIKRVLKKTGTCWVNLGDTYSQGGGSGSKEYARNNHSQFGRKPKEGQYVPPKNVKGFKPKCMLMVPQRFAIEMINRGWILRNVIIWKKPNPMPSSAKDRFTNDFEYVYFFVKTKNYYFDQESVKEPVSQKKSTQNRYKYQVGNQNNRKDENVKFVKPGKPFSKYFPQTRNKRCVWEIPTKSNPENHFATFPPDLIIPMIKCGSPKFTDKPGLILDPFAGTGTTLLEAFKLGRNFLGFEISKEYCNIARKYLKKDTNFTRLTEFIHTKENEVEHDKIS